MSRRSFVSLLVPGGLAATGVARAAGIAEFVTTIAQLAEPLGHIFEGQARVTALMGPGSDPHTYSLLRTDLVRLAGADAILHVGLGLEGRMSEVIGGFGSQRLIGAGALAPSGALLRLRRIDNQVIVDPHLWMDPVLWLETLENCVDALARWFPGPVERSRAALLRYRRQILDLDDYARTVLATLPRSARVLVTAHDAFAYFCRRYGLEHHGIQGISTDSEAGLNRIRTLVDLVYRHDLPAVFPESSVNNRVVRAVIEGARARGARVRAGPVLYSDAMGAAGSYTGTYVGMFDHNVTGIVRALGGEAPPGGLRGML